MAEILDLSDHRVTDLYQVYSVATDYPTKGAIFHGVNFNWFVVERPKPIRNYEALIERYSTLDKDDRFYVNDKHTDKRALLAYLSALHAENPEAPLVIIPNAASTSDSLVFALDVGRILNLPTSLSPEMH